jgi:hypothetical protein
MHGHPITVAKLGHTILDCLPHRGRIRVGALVHAARLGRREDVSEVREERRREWKGDFGFFGCVG